MISIIIPVFNASRTLKETLDSTLLSGLTKQEIIVVDDGSIDDSMIIAKKFKESNLGQDIKIIKSPENRGGGAARNLGIKNSNYSNIFVLDSDDILNEGSLSKAFDELETNNVDGVATGYASFFCDSIKHPLRTYTYPKKRFYFNDVVSHQPNPIIGNFLFRKNLFNDVGGYPENHGFDTQGFGFRVMRQRANILISSSHLYYQRIPKTPSYYLREARAGNVNKNWFFIFFESLYKFDSLTRELILNFDFSNPVEIAKGNHIFNVLASISETKSIFDETSFLMNDIQAYQFYKDSSDFTLQVWCIFYEINQGFYRKGFDRYKSIKAHLKNYRVLYPLLSEFFGNKMSDEDISDLIYFFSKEKSFYWKFKNLTQRVKQNILRGKKS